MKTVGLITEYNPFHNGHKYHVEEAKRITGADYAIAIMSGDFVQRGTPALIDKYSRTYMALSNGVDLVLELPVCYATGSAEYFAHGAVSILSKLGMIDFLCFGSESGDINLLGEAADYLLNTPVSFDDHLQAFLKDGLTFPAARLKALQHSLRDTDAKNAEALTKILTEPNNILGIEYLKAIKQFSSSMLPVTIRRKSAHYHDISLSEQNRSNTLPKDDIGNQNDTNGFSDSVISSATAIRRAIHSNASDAEDYFEGISHSVPENVFELLTDCYLKNYPITEEDFSQIVKYKLLTEDNRSLTQYMDITGDLADRIKNIADLNCSISDLNNKIKTKNMTLTRINRALVHLLLNIRSEAVTEYTANGYSFYARVLGIKKESSHLLRKIEKNESIPIITKVSKAREQLNPLGMRMLSEDIFASHLFNQAVFQKFGTVIPNEYRHGICIL
jgi:predicted nucleotidyltransferase